MYTNGVMRSPGFGTARPCAWGIYSKGLPQEELENSMCSQHTDTQGTLL